MSNIPYSTIEGIRLHVLGSEENNIESCVKILIPEGTKHSKPLKDGLNDSHMGSTAYSERCETCKNDKTLCPGHFGSISLNYPVLSPMFMKDIIKWLKIVCFNCGGLIIPYEKMPVRKENILGAFVKLAARPANKQIQCPNPECKSIHPHVVQDKSDYVSINIEIRSKSDEDSKTIVTKLFPHHILEIFNRISDETVLLMGKPVDCHPKKFVLTVLRASPNSIRPDIKKMSGGRSNSNDLTVLMQYIVKTNNQIQKGNYKSIETNKSEQDMVYNLATAVYALIKGGSGVNKRYLANNSKKPLTSIAKRWTRKYGRVRRNLMGRRASNMGRSFITCDTFLKADEVGIPISMAKDIQFPEIVREYNMEVMMIYYMNGVERYPGCTKIKDGETGTMYTIEGAKKQNRRLKVGDTIFRDIITGDNVGFNRQPSLECSSISSMKVVIMEKGDTFRINVSACPLFNADFDGDAMNVLFVRSIRTMYELDKLSSPLQFFISYKHGKPRIGQSQDGLIGVPELTKNDTRIDKYHAMQIFNQVNIYPNFSDAGAAKIFNGRDMISILLRETGNLINYTGIASSYKEEQAPYREYNPLDYKVIIDRGNVTSGILDKNSIGQEASGGLFHIIHNQYGPRAAIDSAFDMQQIGLAYLQNHGASVTIRDLILKEESIQHIHNIERGLIKESIEITERLNQGKIIAPLGKTVNEYYEEMQINALNPGDEFWPHILQSIDTDHNNMYKMIMYGAKGKLINFAQISAAIGQQDIDGSRIPENFDGRTLPYFTKFDSNPSARGYVTNSYMSGILPPEFIFTAENARYQFINNALSTSITGMYNRMSIKNLESLIVDNQYKVVNGDKVVQLIYGGDGADPRFIEKVKLPTMDKSLSNASFAQKFHTKKEIFAKEFHTKQVQTLLDEEFTQLKQDQEFYRNLFLPVEESTGKMYSDTCMMPVNINRIIEDTLFNLELRKFTKSVALNPIITIEKVKELCNNIVYCLINQGDVPKYLQIATTLMQVLIRSYLNTSYLVNKNINDTALEIIIKQIRNIYSKSLIDYGKAVGIIAAQSISEPMTQAVLDSKHSAGAGSTRKKGMFRVKEILGARPTDKMKAPSMTLQVKPEYKKDKAKVQEIANYIEMLNLGRFVDSWYVFAEKYGEITHPKFKHENELIKSFEKYNTHIKPPSDLTKWCIRIELNKSKMIEKQMKMETIYAILRKNFPAIYIVYTTDNAEQLILRLYIRNVISKKQITVDFMNELAANILDTVIRGVAGVKAAYVQEKSKTLLQEDGSLATETVYFIFTDGTNLEYILENPYIEQETVQSDSIIETYEIFDIMAARQKIINEMKHQIEGPNTRHYDIYANEMTYSGVVTSIDRYGSAKRDSLLMVRVSDSSPINVLTEGAVNGIMDNLNSISGPVMFGKNPEIGDLYNTFIVDEEFVRSQYKSSEDLINEL
jgi:DNA-directed RNA polymerase II subunit RPB1